MTMFWRRQTEPAGNYPPQSPVLPNVPFGPDTMGENTFLGRLQGTGRPSAIPLSYIPVLVASNLNIQIEAGAGTIVVADATQLLVLNKASAGATTVNLGAVAARDKIELAISDWAGNAGDITVVPFGTDKIGGSTGSWTIASGGLAQTGGTLRLLPSKDIGGWIVVSTQTELAAGAIPYGRGPGVTGYGSITASASAVLITNSSSVPGFSQTLPTLTGPLKLNGIFEIFDTTQSRYGGIATEQTGKLIELGINDSSTNRFGGAYTSADQGGFLRFDTRAGQNLFQIFGRAAASTSAVAAYVTINPPGAVQFNAYGAGLLHSDASGVLTSSAASLTADISGVLPVANGGTNLASGTSGGVLAYTASGVLASSAPLGANRIVLGGGAGAVPATLGSLGTTTTVLHGNASGAPTFGAVSLTADVSGVLPNANTNIGTSGATIPLLNAANTWSGSQLFGLASSSTGIDLSTNNNILEARIIRNSGSAIDHDLYLGFSSGTTSALHLYSNNTEVVTVAGGNTVKVNGLIQMLDSGSQNRNAGIVTESSAVMIDFGINDSSTNRFGGTYTSADQGGFVRFDTRSGQPLFGIFGRAAASTSGVSELFRVATNGAVRFSAYARGALMSATTAGDIINSLDRIYVENYAVTLNSSGSAAANVTQINLAIADAQGKHLIYPAGVIYVNAAIDHSGVSKVSGAGAGGGFYSHGFTGNGTTIRTTSTTANVVTATTVQGITFEDIAVEGPSSAGAGTSTAGSLMLIQAGGSAANHALRINRVRFEYGYQQCSLKDQVNWTVSNCQFINTKLGMLDTDVPIKFDLGDWSITGCVFQQIDFNANTGSWCIKWNGGGGRITDNKFTTGDGVGGATIDQLIWGYLGVSSPTIPGTASGTIIIANNSIEGGKNYGILIQQAVALYTFALIQIVNNEFQGGVNTAMIRILPGAANAQWIKQTNISLNVIDMGTTAGAYGIWLQDSPGATITGNIFTSFGNAGPVAITTDNNAAGVIVANNNAIDLPSGKYGPLTSTTIVTDTTGVTYSQLGSWGNGSVVYVTDGKATSSTNFVGASGGSGSTFRRENGAWYATPQTLPTFVSLSAANTWTAVQTYGLSTGTTAIDLATNNNYLNARIIRNEGSTAGNDLYLGFGGTATSQLHMYSNNTEVMTLSGGNLVTVNGQVRTNVTAGTVGFDLATHDNYLECRVLRNQNSGTDKDMHIGFLSGATSALHLYSNNTEVITVSGGNAVTVAGTVKGGVDITTAWPFEAPTTVTIANGSSATLAAGSGLVVITDSTATGDTAAYLFGGGSGGAMIGASAGSGFVAPTTTPGAGKASVCFSGSSVKIYNNLGGSATFYVFGARTRPTA